MGSCKKEVTAGEEGVCSVLVTNFYEKYKDWGVKTTIFPLCSFIIIPIIQLRHWIVASIRL